MCFTQFYPTLNRSELFLAVQQVYNGLALLGVSATGCTQECPLLKKTFPRDAHGQLDSHGPPSRASLKALSQTLIVRCDPPKRTSSKSPSAGTLLHWSSKTAFFTLISGRNHPFSTLNLISCSMSGKPQDCFSGQGSSTQGSICVNPPYIKRSWIGYSRIQSYRDLKHGALLSAPFIPCLKV